MDEKTQFNDLLNELKGILDDYDQYRENPEVRIKGEGSKVEEYTNGSITPYQKLLERLDNFCRDYDKNIRQKKTD